MTSDAWEYNAYFLFLPTATSVGGKKAKNTSARHPLWVHKCGSFDLLFSRWKEKQDFSGSTMWPEQHDWMGAACRYDSLLEQHSGLNPNQTLPSDEVSKKQQQKESCSPSASHASADAHHPGTHKRSLDGEHTLELARASVTGACRRLRHKKGLSRRGVPAFHRLFFCSLTDELSAEKQPLLLPPPIPKPHWLIWSSMDQSTGYYGLNVSFTAAVNGFDLADMHDQNSKTVLVQSKDWGCKYDCIISA